MRIISKERKPQSYDNWWQWYNEKAMRRQRRKEYICTAVAVAVLLFAYCFVGYVEVAV